MCSGSLKLRGFGWYHVGCKCGTIKKEMAPIELCPQLGDNPQPQPPNVSAIPPKTLNLIARADLRRREQELTTAGSLVTRSYVDIDALLQQHEGSWQALQGLRLSRNSQDEHPSLPRRPPLDNCVISILWEILDQSRLDLLPNTDTVKFTVLLRSASLYQAKSEKVRYIFI
jgi:hypothetical protein